MASPQTSRKKAAPYFIILALCGVVIALNSFQTFRIIKTYHILRKFMPYEFLGLKFAGLNNFVTGSRYVGYYTDKDMDKLENSAQYAQAQYVTAPLILDLNNLKHPYILFDCSTERKAMEIIKKIGAIPLKKNQFGIILAIRGPESSEEAHP